jgi:hypothetical protein
VSAEARRLESGGRIDRTRRLSFRFDGKQYQGFAGDTLASALLANGVRIVGRSFKLHRPRGLLGGWCEEPNAIVQVGRGADLVPNLKATQVELFDGLTARSVNLDLTKNSCGTRQTLFDAGEQALRGGVARESQY